jgi:dCTP deaminase
MTHWPEGVLPRQALREFIEAGYIASDAEIPDKNLQPASIDLTLGPVAYRLRSSFLPGSVTVREKLSEYAMGELDLTGDGAVLEQNRPYLIPLEERISLPEGIRGRTNPRSSTGRLDVFTRVITDKGAHFDDIREGYDGALFLEIVPMSFTVKARAGITLNQLRLISGRARVSGDDLIKLHDTEPIVFAGSSSKPGDQVRVADGVFLSVDLEGEGMPFAGYKAKFNSGLLDLSRQGTYQINDFWERVEAKKGRLTLEAGAFYLLVSRERVRIPPDYAAEMAAYDPTSGELRTHYAGFFDPGFGDVVGDSPGTPAVLEVRAHDVPFSLEHGQRVCTLTFEKMSSRPEILYGSDLGSRYQRQYISLSRQFRADQLGMRKPRLRTRVDQRPLNLVPDERPPLPVLPRE